MVRLPAHTARNPRQQGRVVANNTRTSLSADALRNALRVVHPDAPAADSLTTIAGLARRLAPGYWVCPLRDCVPDPLLPAGAAGIDGAFVPRQAVSIVA